MTIMETKKKTMYVQPKAEVVNCKMENLLQTGSTITGDSRSYNKWEDEYE